MFNRRFIRVKVFQILYAYYTEAYSSLDEADKDLKHLFDRIYDLYHFILLLLVEFSDYLKFRTEKSKKRFIKNEEDPVQKHARFLNNKLISQIRNNVQLTEYLKNRKYTWHRSNTLFKEIYDRLLQSPEYRKYIDSPEVNYEDDRKIILFFIEAILYNNQTFYSQLEEETIYWVDNVDFSLLATTITLEGFVAGTNSNKKLLKKFKNEDDERFSLTLLRKSILKIEEYSEIIRQNVINWDYERISVVDKMILILALCELTEFSEIPVKVTLNEYIELAKQYGIPNKSWAFVNGLLDKIVDFLNKEGKISKSGRGLIIK